MRGGVFVALGAAWSIALAGCAATTPTSKVAVDYNRIFAKARNEVLVTNILRASEREPLQFSTMGSVTGGVRNSGSIDLSIASLVGKGATILSPDILVNEGINPTVSIVPLSNKEFTEGILRPVTLDEINYFIGQGWDKELILELVVGGIVCPDGKVVFNHGDPSANAQYEAFAAMFAAADRFPIHSVGKPETTTIRMSAATALSAMKDGAGSGRSVAAVEPVKENGKATGDVEVTIITAPPAEFTGLRTDMVCGTQGAQQHAPVQTEGLVAVASSNGQQAKVILRSPEAIITFLGDTQWWRWSGPNGGPRTPATNDWPYYWRRTTVDGVDRMQRRTLLAIDKTRGKMPLVFRSFVQTHFNDDDYYVLRQEDAGDQDRSLSTLSLLDQLISLQTSESSIAAASPILAIGAK
jgi:hypothetical protein